MRSARSAGSRNSRGGGGPKEYRNSWPLPLLGPVLVLLGDAIDVRGVLDVGPAGLAEVPEPVRSDGVATDAPHLPVGVGIDHRLPATDHVVDVVDLERDVVRVGDGCSLDGQVVVHRTAAREGDDARNLVADLEADHVGEEREGRRLVGRAVHDVREVRRPDRLVGQHARCRYVDAFGLRARTIERVRRGRRDVGLGDGHLDEEAGGEFAQREQIRCGVDDLRVQRVGGTGCDAGEVVLVLGTDAEAEQSPTGRADQLDLFASVAGGEACRLTRVRRRFGEAEVAEERGRRLDIGNAQGDRRQAVQPHRWTN